MKSLTAALALAAGTAFVAAPVSASEVLLKKNNCTACHAIDKKLVGPAYKDVAKKYAGDAGAEKMLSEKVKKGGKGTWGQIPMPPNPQVSDADITAMIKYILSLK
ncbi:MAG: c-type cytochrome [Burkholderiales bacterium]